MKVVALAGSRGLYLVATGRPRCGQVPARWMQLPTSAAAPFEARLLRSRWGIALLDVRPITLEEYVGQHHGQAIEGEVRGGVLRGVVCDRPVRARVLDPTVEGPVLALVPVSRVGRGPPRVVASLLAYPLLLP